MRPPMIVLAFPLRKQAPQFLRAVKGEPPIEFFLVGAVAAFRLPVALWAAAGNVPVDDPEGVELPGEIGPELGAVIGFDALDGDGVALAGLVDEGDRRLDRVVIIDLRDPVAGRLVNRDELVEAPRAQFEVFDVNLHRLARDVKVPSPAGTRPVPL